MEVIVERACGLDVHQAVIVACVLIGQGDGRVQKHTRSFGTVSKELLEMYEWLKQLEVTHVGMESTGVYWEPVNAVLEEDFKVIVGNAQHMKGVPGRKTDMKDAEWIATLVRMGLIKSSFVPPKPIRALREVVRYRRKVVQARASERTRLIKLLERCGIKLATFMTNIFGVSGMAMLKKLAGEGGAPAELAKLAKGRLRKKVPDLELALDAKLAEHQQFLMRMQLERLEQAGRQVEQLDERIDQMLAPYRTQVTRLKTIAGVSTVASAEIVAEIGVDMTVFKSPAHLASWAGVCPGNHESAGKRRKGTARKGNIHLTTTLVEAAQAASRKKKSYLRDKFHRLKARRGYKRAVMAIAHKLLIAVYHVLLNGENYRDLGEAYLDQRDKSRVTNTLVRKLEALGYAVALQPIAA